MGRLALTVLAGIWLLAAGAAAEPQIALTFDDLPVHGVMPSGATRVGIAQSVIDSLKAARLPPVYGFVNGVGIERELASAPVIRMWVEAGNLLGNHTWSHPGLSQKSVADYEDEIARNEPVLQQAMDGRDWHWFRYPFLDEGSTPEKRAAIRAFLAARGYRIAGVSMGLSDWLYNEPYARCLAKHDDVAVAQLEKDFMTAAAEDVAYRRAASRVVIGHEIPFVMLLHIGAFEAHMLPQLLAFYRAQGFSFVTLDKAESDPYYRQIRDPGQPAGSTGLDEDVWKQPKPMPPRTDFGPALKAICR